MMRKLLFAHILLYRMLALAALVGVCALAPMSFATRGAHADGVIETQVNLSNSAQHSEAPSLALGGGRIGAIWGERETDSLATASATLGGSFEPPGLLPTGTRTAQQWSDMAVDGGGMVHIAYASGNGVFYRKKPAGETWSSAIAVASDTSPGPVRMALAPNGTIWIIWRDKDGTRIGFKFSDNGGAGWSGGEAGGVVAAESGTMSAPDIAVGPDMVPHVVWYIYGSGPAKGEIRYADWDGARFVPGQLTHDGAALYDADPVIAIDGSNMQHVAFRKQLAEDGSAWSITYVTRKPGQAWKEFQPLATTQGDAKYAPGIGVDALGSVYIGYSDPLATSGETGIRRITLLSRTAGQATWAKQVISSGRWDYMPAIVGTTEGGLKAHVVYQNEQVADKAEIMYTRVRTAETPAVSATPVINNNATFTRDNQVVVTFSEVTGAPKELRWRWGAPPTDTAADSAGWTAFGNPVTIPLPSLAPGECQQLTLFTQVRNGAQAQTSAQSDAITFDAHVQAEVRVTNPRQAARPSTYGEGATDGATGFTRSSMFHVAIHDMHDCAGLKSYSVGGGAPIAVAAGSVEAEHALSADTPGPDAVTVTVLDANNNSATYERQIILDRAAPAVTSADVRASGENALLQTITVSNPVVNDDMFGSIAGLPPGRQFWGVFVAASRGAPISGDINANTSLLWTPIRVANPDQNRFSVTYNLFDGQSGNGMKDAAGIYYVYLKFLDGAGNPSTWTSQPVQVTLAPGYAVPTQQLPMIRN